MPAEVIQVVHTDIARRGKGVTGDPVRVVEQFWSLSGDLLAEVDPFTPPVQDAPLSYARYNEQARRALDYALREAMSAGADYIGPEHIVAACKRVEEQAS